ncbi:MAG: clan AA aspartic protease, partial [Bacteroidia bacterium]|nr:clan AA aspartic protease [Bacteroidia bacterium]
MGLVYSDITLSNPVFPDLKSIEVKCLVDTGSVFLCLPSHIAAQLNLKQLETREAVLTDGNSQQVPYVGPVRVTFGNRNCFVGALVIGNEVLLGAVPMEDMDLVVSP